ncbi:hypothetical protein GCM10010978_09760 [Compostibacillus humi]|jgi:predicted nucleic-acid-binding Zn-ribbon protein|uniref:Nucleic acid-binding protein n=1 Tax=Compostibacillus humi TaxID=1245525 RepID=A0A8J2ZRD5_9BACI|nr:zinc ribbon domain-containing protein [Compostibacillus humi]GGH72652.1 hypothetical protein GCM10010978_09760 [Compostibacillus humi]HLT56459.1 zinc ribbon domain-containing protein [Bacillota bacterium]
MNEEKGCKKCGSTRANSKKVAMTGTGFTKIFDIQQNEFTVVYCEDCGYSEFYHTKSSKGSNILDAFFI